jgi:CO/xanthine dehydrogenase FAD-binding subunit
VPVEPPVVTPRSLAEAYALMVAEPYEPIAGGTDLMVAITGELREPPDRVLDLWRLDQLRGIALSDDGSALAIGALTTYTELRRSPLVAAHVPTLAEAAATVGSAQIQNRGTIGGNIANASPAGDTLPVLLAADAAIVLGSVRGERSVPAADFWTSYRRTARHPDELVLRVVTPVVPDRRMRFRKVGTRRAQAISKVVMALAWREDGGAWRDVRLALGSVAPTPIRASATEAVLDGARPDEATAQRAAATISGEIRPIDDVRSTAEYRRAVAGRILLRMLRDEGGW